MRPQYKSPSTVAGTFWSGQLQGYQVCLLKILAFGEFDLRLMCPGRSRFKWILADQPFWVSVIFSAWRPQDRLVNAVAFVKFTCTWCVHEFARIGTRSKIHFPCQYAFLAFSAHNPYYFIPESPHCNSTLFDGLVSLSTLRTGHIHAQESLNELNDTSLSPHTHTRLTKTKSTYRSQQKSKVR